MEEEVTDVAEYLLGDIRLFKAEKQQKEQLTNAKNDNLTKLMKKIEKSKQRMQSTLQALHFDTERLKNSVPSDAILKQFCDENCLSSEALEAMLDMPLKEPAVPNREISQYDLARLVEFRSKLKQMLF